MEQRIVNPQNVIEVPKAEDLADSIAEHLAELVATEAAVLEFGSVDAAAFAAVDFVARGLLNSPELAARNLTQEQAEGYAMDAISAPCDWCRVWPKPCMCEASGSFAERPRFDAVDASDEIAADRMEVEIDGDF